MPRPERVTEFYFSHHRDLSVPARSDRTRTVGFTVHNREHQTTDYRYTLSVVSADGVTEQAVGSGSFTLGHDRSLKTSKRITLPPTAGQIAIKARLEYKGIAFGDRMPSAQVQSIHYWTNATAPDGDKEGHEGT